MMPEIEIK